MRGPAGPRLAAAGKRRGSTHEKHELYTWCFSSKVCSGIPRARRRGRPTYSRASSVPRGIFRTMAMLAAAAGMPTRNAHW